MVDSILVDNDVILKVCCFASVDEFVDCLAGVGGKVQILGVARYVLGKAITKRRSIVNKARAADHLAKFFARAWSIEPSDFELELAVEFEQVALSSGLDLDGGESLLLAVLISRHAKLLATGDKRAIRAMEHLTDLRGSSEVGHRVACLEQIIMAMICQHGVERFRSRICSEEAMDTTMAICFSCASGLRSAESIVDALTSYIRDLRTLAPNILVDSDDLSTVVSKEDGVR